jgi:FkbM family methyltransferase
LANLLPLDLLVQRYNLRVTGVLHLGAHVGQEAPTYARQGITEVTWVEADPLVFATLEQVVRPYGHRAVNALVSDRDDESVEFYRTNNEKSSSLLRMRTHRYEHPDVVVTETLRLRTTTVDTMCARLGIKDFNFMTLDLQGAELLALHGATESLSHTRYLFIEVNTEELYEGCPHVEDLDRFLSNYERVETAMTDHNWGDAFYVRTDPTV